MRALDGCERHGIHGGDDDDGGIEITRPTECCSALHAPGFVEAPPRIDRLSK